MLASTDHMEPYSPIDIAPNKGKGTNSDCVSLFSAGQVTHSVNPDIGSTVVAKAVF